jgi:nicotinamidase-related amidase
MSGAHLVVIDMQRVFGEPGSPWATPRFAEVLPPITELAKVASAPPTFTRFVAPQQPTGIWAAYYQQWPFAQQSPDSGLYQLVEEFAASAGPTVDATTFGKWGPELAARQGARPSMVLCGVSTDCCVLSTALAAADAGIQVLVVGDACAGVDDQSQAAALHVMNLYSPLITVVGLDEGLHQVAA